MFKNTNPMGLHSRLLCLKFLTPLSENPGSAPGVCVCVYVHVCMYVCVCDVNCINTCRDGPVLPTNRDIFFNDNLYHVVFTINNNHERQ